MSEAISNKLTRNIHPFQQSSGRPIPTMKAAHSLQEVVEFQAEGGTNGQDFKN